MYTDDLISRDVGLDDTVLITYDRTYGHPQGDRLLQAIAKIFTETLNRKTDYIARWGGEEFITLLPNVALPGALTVAEKIRSNIENASILCPDGIPTSITVSIGVNTGIPTADSTIIDFIAKADQALYVAKDLNRNKVFVL